MARSYARLLISVWGDDDFRKLPEPAQRVFFLLISQPTTSFCGVAPFTPKRWARMSSTSTVKGVRASVGTLEAAGYVVVDEDTEEILVRSFVKHDGVLDHTNLRVAMWKAFGEVESDAIRNAILDGIPDAFRDEIPNTSNSNITLTLTATDTVSERIKSATKLALDRRYLKYRAEVRNEHAWRKVVGGEMREALEDLAVEHPDWSADQLADHLEVNSLHKFLPLCGLCWNGNVETADGGVVRCECRQAVGR